MDRNQPGKVEDLATLAKLDDNVLLEELKIRYANNNIYVSIFTYCYRQLITLMKERRY